MTRQRLRRTAGIMILACSLVALAWALWPLPEASSRIAIPPENMQLPTLVGGAGAPPAVREARLVELRWSPKVRLGDSQVIRLSIDVDPQVSSSSEPDVYSTHNVLAEALLELPGAEITPGSAISTPLRSGRSVTFLWSARPLRAGETSGDLSLHLRFVPLAAGPSAVESRRLVSSQRIEVQAASLFGLSGPTARLLGSVGVLLGVLLGLDPLYKKFAVWLMGKLQPRP